MASTTHYDRTARWLHWSMAAMVLAMLFIGVGMVASLELRPWLIDLHRPLGLLVLALAVVRLWHRRRNPPPPLPLKIVVISVAAALATSVMVGRRAGGGAGVRAGTVDGAAAQWPPMVIKPRAPA